MQQTRYRRRKKLVRPAFQMRMIGRFVGISVLAMLLQFLIVGQDLMQSLVGARVTGEDFSEALPWMLARSFFVSMAIILPLMIGFGLLFTFRIAGPMHRIQTYLDDIASGAAARPCLLRDNDELEALCELTNRATAPLLGKPDVSEHEPVRDAG